MAVYREPADLSAACAELLASRHSVQIWLGAMSDAAPSLMGHTRITGMTGGKPENINALWADWRTQQLPAPDWTLVIDDDVRLSRHFLDRFLALCERFDLTLAQPAQSRRSHAAWPVTRRQPHSLVRETRFVEVGPVTAFRQEAAARLLPLPPLRYGWGVDQHWGAVAELEGWRIGVVDATPVRHERQGIAVSYSQAEAAADRERFLSHNPHLTRDLANVTVRMHRRVPVQRGWLTRNGGSLGQLVRANPRAALSSYRIARRAIDLRAEQKIREFAPFLAYASRKPPATVVEIGSSLGGTFYAWCRIADPDALIVGIDLPGGAFGEFGRETVERMNHYRVHDQRVEPIVGDSHDPDSRAKLEDMLDGRRIDLLFIDGDHSYEGVKQDFEMYAPLASLVALHDVLPHPNVSGCDVDRYWSELKSRHRCVEFLDPEDNRFGSGQWGGIGVVVDPSTLRT
jgi:predicted O-methyltransferase YrrM